MNQEFALSGLTLAGCLWFFVGTPGLMAGAARKTFAEQWDRT
jgi:hypothetical protein